MPGQHVCVICRDLVGPRSINRICEHDLCDLCRLGELGGRVAERGWTLGVKDDLLNSSGHQLSQVDIEAHLPRPITLQARFRREGRFSLDVRLMKLFGRELTVGDPLFDDQVFIRTTTPDDTALFLSVPSVQTAIQELLWQEQGERNHITIRDGKLEVHGLSSNTSFAQEAQVLTCILLHHLEGFTAPETGERGPYR